MIKYILIFVLTFGFLNHGKAKEPSEKIEGIWLNEDKTNKIELYKANNTYSGKIVWLEKLENNPNLNLKDKRNPNPELRNREILGMNIINNLQYSDDKWINGKIYTPKRGIYADCAVELLSNDMLKITVSKSGYTRTQIWTRK